MEKKQVILTYGTFDLFHIGHLRLLQRLRSLGDFLVVGVSTDEFNQGKGKKTIIPFEDRIEIVRNIKCVDVAIPEESWDQKINDIKKYQVSIFGMGDDWQGKFDFLGEYCEVVYLPRTESVSSSSIKNSLSEFSRDRIQKLKEALDAMSSVVGTLSQ